MTVDTLTSRISHLGLAQTLGHYAARGFVEATGLEIFHLLAIEPSGLRGESRPPDGVEVCRVPPTVFRREVSTEGWGLSPAAVEAELAKGDACYGAFAGGRLASYIFVARGATALDSRLTIRFDPSWAFSRWAYTHPERRGLRLHALVKGFAIRDQAVDGRRGLLSLVPASNAESLRAGLRLGCRRVSSLAVLRTAGWARAWHGRGCAAFGLAVAGVTRRP